MPQPIDMPTELNRIAAAERIQQIADRASLAAQHRMHAQTDEERMATETVVQQPKEQAEKQGLDPEGHQDEGRPRRKRKKRDEADKRATVFYNAEEHEEIAEDDEDHNLDVTI